MVVPTPAEGPLMGILYAQIDCDLPRDPRMIAVGPVGRMMYVQCILYCRENLTDGVIDKLCLPLIAMDIASPLKHLARLVEVGALVATNTGWKIPETVWRRRNPLKSEVDASRQAEAERKARYREKSQRDKQGTPTGTASGQARDTNVTATGRPRQEEEEEKPEPKEEPKPEEKIVVTRQTSSSATGYPSPRTEGASQGPEPNADPRIEAVLDTYVANAWAGANQGAIRNHLAFRRSKRDEAIANPELARLSREYPTASASEIAAWLAGERNTMRYHDRVTA